MIYIGTIGWNYNHWTKNFYPNEDSSEWLTYYTSQASFAEIRLSYHRLPKLETVQKWVSDTPEDFIFSASLPRRITQHPKYQVNEDLIDEFFERVSPLANRLGMVILHFPAKMQNTTATLRYLTEILDYSQNKFSGYFILNLKNRSWSRQNIMELISDKSAILASTDRNPVVSVMRDPRIYYLRLLGDKRIISSKEFGTSKFPRDEDLDQWAIHLKFLNKKHQQIYVSIDNHFSGNAIADSIQLTEKLTKLKIQCKGLTQAVTA